MTEFEKQIYNSYLRISRQKLDKPFKLRQDWTDFEKDEKYFFVQKLAAFFQKFPHIKVDSFFSAPYEYYNEKTQYSLDYFTSLKAVTVFRLNEKKKMTESPDEKNQLIFALETINYIKQFTKDKKIPFEDYIKYKSESTPQFILDIKDRTISVYVLFGFQNFETILGEFGADLVKFILSEDFYEILDTMRTKFFNSKTTKNIIKQQITKLTIKTI